MHTSAVDFLKEFVTNPQEIGAIVPSSEELAAAVAGCIDWGRVRVAAEYGPGLGSITAAILERLDGQDFFAIELNESYAETLRHQFPDLKIYGDSVAHVETIVARHGVASIDAVVSSLPWANFSEELQDELLEATMKVLSPGGQFATFSYVHGLVLKSGIRFRGKLERQFRTVTRSDVVWRSVPPAVVYHCER